MKAVLTLCVLGLVLLTSSYACSIASECSGSCDLSSNHWACINHACVCRPNGSSSGTCSQKDDCRRTCSHHDHYHCIDGHCKCGELGDN
ncbi:serine protease inhibitor Cvsi-2-like [Crassostrea angulata]|uniref:serine protease inhibitor Cvsi-2-like n=1 Tax=Magallana angulata TaxID=2784310 RepID=UPI0022B1BC61|nr:serine protease inhibitor Cvsi-2-like [Crassostrea angulata]